MKNVRKKYNLKSFLIPKLRRLSYMWPGRKEAQVKGRIERGKYKCADCGGIFGPKEISMDHINPVIDPEKGFTDWNDYINRLFCEADGFQILCNADHDKKTEKEDNQRKKLTDKNKSDTFLKTPKKGKKRAR